MNYSRKYLLAAGIGLGTLVGLTACHKTTQAAQIQDVSNDGDPSDQNMAPVDSSGQPITGAPAYQSTNESQQQAAPYTSGGAPIVRQAPGATAPSPDQYAAQQAAQGDDQNYDADNYDQQLVDQGQAALEAPDAPPELPVYEQPPAPDPDYLWTPGYWDYAPAGGYYWVPGAWVSSPYVGALWTPGYWFFFGNHYRFHRGYWGPHIGFYGGINYGFGYFGTGYNGGYWNGNHFYYNRNVVNVGRVSYVYSHPVTIVNRGNRVAFNGPRGIQARPRPAEIAAMRGPRIPPMTAQVNNARNAQQNRAQFYNQNKGRPATVASPRPFIADKNIARPAASQLPPRVTNPGRPGEPAAQVRPGFGNNRPDNNNNRPGNDNRPAQPGNQVRPGQPSQPGQPGNQVRPGQPDVRPNPGQGQTRPTPQPDIRPTPGRPEVRPTPQPEARPVPQQPFNRPQPNNNNNNRPGGNFQRPTPQPEVRPTPQPTPQPRPAPEVRPAPQPRPAPEVRQEQRPAPAPRPAPQAGQAPHPAPHVQPPPRAEDRPKR